jgi:hypothetical protein
MQDLLPGERPKPKPAYGKHARDPALDIGIFMGVGAKIAASPKRKHEWPSDTMDRVETPAVKCKILTIRDDSTASQPTGNSVDPEGVHIGQPAKVR